MKKIPTIFARDWDGTIGPPARFVLDEPHPDCGWVFAGEGFPTRKIDGTSCLVQDGKLFKRLELRGRVEGDTTKFAVYPDPPDGFIRAAEDLSGEKPKLIGWVPVGDGPEDQWHRAAWQFPAEKHDGAWTPDWGLPDGTYELVGPHIQGNPENVTFDYLWSHDDLDFREDDAPPRTYEGLKAWLATHDVEGVVWHHPDGRMAKIKGKDFGIKRADVKQALAK